MAEATPAELLEAAIATVWNERDDARRLAAMQRLYHGDAVIHEPERSVVGHEAISAVVAGVLADLPAGFAFDVTGPTHGHHGLAVTRWQGGSGGEVTVSGADAVRVTGGRIREHWFFFDPRG